MLPKFWLVAAILAGTVWLIQMIQVMRENFIEGFEACYYDPWWRHYEKNPTYKYSGKHPYYKGLWYWWPYYGKNYYQNYWKNYGYRFD